MRGAKRTKAQKLKAISYTTQSWSHNTYIRFNFVSPLNTLAGIAVILLSDNRLWWRKDNNQNQLSCCDSHKQSSINRFNIAKTDMCSCVFLGFWFVCKYIVRFDWLIWRLEKQHKHKQIQKQTNPNVKRKLKKEQWRAKA